MTATTGTARLDPNCRIGLAYYNEIDADAVLVLEQCIADGVIAPGYVDTRSIKEVQADDLRGFTQCHFFAGGGLWSVAARMAGWPDSRPLWTGSCPCQPFSAAGKGGGTDDPRHLWPDLYRLVRAARECGFGPSVCMGEQVAGAAGYNWFDGVRADLAREGISSRTVDFPACAVDAPHQRNRLYWIAVAKDISSERDGGAIVAQRGPEGRNAAFRYDAGSGQSELGDTFVSRLEGHAGHGNDRRRPEPDRPIAAPNGAGAAGHVDDPDSEGRLQSQGPVGLVGGRRGDTNARRNGSSWAGAEWITCHDGKARRTKPGLRLLVDGLPGRVGLWRVGGNAISPVAAAEVIAAFLDAEQEFAA